MKFAWYSVAVTLLFWLGTASIAYREGTLWRSQGKVDMTFWWNWAVSIGLPIFAPINWLAIPSIIKAGHPWYVYLLCLYVGYDITRRFYESWQKHKEYNTGHIIDKYGQITTAGEVHFPYMVLQIMVVLLFVFTLVPDKTQVLWVGTLLFVFLLIQSIQSKVVQKSFSWESIPEMMGAVLITVLKYKGIF